jgi:hypothetical protein
MKKKTSENTAGVEAMLIFLITIISVVLTAYLTQ